MSFMTEKRANELLGQYTQAEIKGQDADADQIEKLLNDSGWFIRSSQDGMIVQRKDWQGNLPELDDYYLPEESTLQPYKGTPAKSNKTMWITIGVLAGVIALTILAVYIVKKRNNATPS